MSALRPTRPPRIPEYLGPRGGIEPHELDAFDAAGCWAAEVKHDGCWALLRTDWAGRVASIVGRRGDPYGGVHVDGLLGLRCGLRATVLAGELETATEAATATVRRLGHRRFHAFDVLSYLGEDTVRRCSYDERREVLAHLWSRFVYPSCADHYMPFVVHVLGGFRAFYDDVVGAGGEGLVLKRRSSPYDAAWGRAGRPALASRKVDFWLRCKPEHHVDYVVVGVGETELGQPNLLLGLWRGSGPRRVGKVLVPPHLVGSEHQLVGRVVELKGAEVFASGMVRHGVFVRVRDDKAPEDCAPPARRGEVDDDDEAAG